MPDPYYEDEGVTIYCGDAREILPQIGRADCGITDPPWPDGERLDLCRGESHWQVWEETAPLLVSRVERLIVWLGVRSDPRFLASVPRSMPYLRSLRLRYPVPSRLGHVTNDGDSAYCFGKGWGHVRAGLLPSHHSPSVVTDEDPWSALDGRRARDTDHPCPRRLGHAIWLVANFTRPEDVVLDPFAGTGTTLLAAKEQGRRAVGIELEERWCAEAVRRLRQRVLFPAVGGRRE